RKRDNRSQDDRSCPPRRRAHERLVNLDRIEREALQVRERGMPGAEIVQRQPGTELLYPGQHLRRVLGVLHDQRFGDLELETPAYQRRAAQYTAQVLDEIVTQKLSRRDVHAGKHRLARARRGLPLGELLGGMVEDEKAKIHDQSDFLGNRDEFRRRKAAKFWVIPARQGLEACNNAILQAHDRLIEHLDLFALDGTAQLGFHGQAVGFARAHGRLENLDAIAADTLGVVHRKLRILEHFVGAVCLVFGQRQADRRREEYLAIVEGNRRAQRAADGLGKRDDARGLALRQQDQGELIA